MDVLLILKQDAILIFDESSSMRSFSAERPVGLLEHFVDLSVIGIQHIPEIVLGLHFGLLHREGCGLSRLSVS